MKILDQRENEYLPQVVLDTMEVSVVSVCVIYGGVWPSGNALVLINKVTLRRARLVLGWVTVCRWINHLGI